MSTADLREARLRLEQALFPLRQRALVVGSLVAVAVAALVVITTLVLGMWIDLTVPLSTGLRRLVLPLAAVSAVAFAIVLLRRSSRDFKEPALARRVDEVSHSGGRVMTGYELTDVDANSKSPRSGALSEGLALIAAGQAEQVCSTVNEAEAIPSDPARYWWKVVGATSLCLCVFAGFVPRMAWTQVQRILVPMESQLPYSPTSISVEPGDTEVLFGDDLELIATISGPLVEDLELVLRYDDQTEERLPMLAETDQRWRTYLTRITEPAEYHVRGGSARSRAHQLRVKLTPQIKAVECRIEQPAYTRRGVYDGPIPESGIEGLAGTNVTIRAQSNRPLKSGTLNLELEGQSQTVALSPVEGSESNLVQGTFTLTHDGQFSLSIADQEGTPSADSVDGVLKVVPDHAPVVRLLQPKPISLATPDVDLPIVVAAEDDYGISRVELFRGLNGSPATSIRLPLEQVQTSARLGTSLPLAAYGLQPGDEITLFARVEDNDPTGSKGAESPIATVRIISRQQLAEIELSQRGIETILSKQRQVQRLLAALKEQLQEAADSAAEAAQKAEAAANNPADASQAQQQAEQAQQQAAQAMNQAAQAMQQAAESMKQLANHSLPIDVDQGMSEQLQELAKKLTDAAKRIQQLKEKMDSGQQLSEAEQQELDDLMKELGAAKDQHQQQSMQPTEQLAKTFPLVADQQRFTQLARRQRSLAQRLDALQAADQSDPAVARRADELRREQQQLQVGLSQLLEDIESHTKQLPADPEFDKLRQTASEFTKQVRGSQADPTMTSTQEDLLKDNPAAATEHATKAADILESFLSQCSGMGDQACENCQAGFNPSAGSAKLGNSVQQLLDRLGLGQGQSGRKPGMAAGMGPGGGYSMPQNTAENIGLYGGLPTPVATPRSGDGDKSDGAIASYAQGGSADATGGAEPKMEATTRGDAAAGVPSLYREQVNDYFRQLADELGDL